MNTNDKNKLDKTNKEITIWEWAARILPFTALAGIIGTWYFGIDDAFDYFVITIVAVFMSIAVYWWWWAIAKIAFLAKMFQSTAERLEKINSDLRQFKKDFKE